MLVTSSGRLACARAPGQVAGIHARHLSRATFILLTTTAQVTLALSPAAPGSPFSVAPS
ncbi:hypothetical protein XFF6990_290090 [Xanthomonas citri pv. fuscans]|uniref:Uncharacterized protein n=1 Tax=Xanthomonas campestris pv. phaseoli TaxID=317013 RepID=A0A7Z7J2T6_XANCH|nr:hypothetical protein XFF6990_290090 [Xanthomonas citri pv. fuscans]SOO26263.1 hypothetical protein XFF6991_530112 [Xanthomonas phaseoli pv. phaseoli]